MGIDSLLWLVILAAPTGAVLGAYRLGLRGRRLYLLCAACACLLAAAAAAPLALRLLGRPAWSGLAPLPLLLVPFAALLWLLTVLVTPASRLDEASLARTAAACLMTMAAFLSASPWLLLLLWAGTCAIYAAGHGEPRFDRARRVAVAYMGASVVLLAAGCLLRAWGGPRGGVWEQTGCGLILAAALIRSGVFPFHAWIPELFDRGRIGPANMFSAPLLGVYVALVLAVPHAHAALLRTAAVLGLITAVYGALLALHQKDARRACGYLFVSQSALVVAGLDIPSREALVGALILWVS
ncbi:MAG: proton-conducting transporter membrane subunit, partial [Elusimicrobiota bacterium]